MNDKGISEIIGEMLLLSIVVTLVAVLSANVFGLLPSFEDIPYASFVGKVNEKSNLINITHEGGDSIPLNDLRIIIDNGSSVIQCHFNRSNLSCNDENVSGNLSDDGNDHWEFGEVLMIDKSKIGEKVKIVIAHRGQVLCKLFFGW